MVLGGGGGGGGGVSRTNVLIKREVQFLMADFDKGWRGGQF